MAAASRSNTPALHIRTPNPRSALTIEEWEAKAPLGDAEIKSVAALKAACELRPVLQPSAVRVSPSPFPLFLTTSDEQRTALGFSRRGWSCVTFSYSTTTRQTRPRLAPFHTARASASRCACACASPGAASANSAAILRLVRVDRSLCRPQSGGALSTTSAACLGAPGHVRQTRQSHRTNRRRSCRNDGRVEKCRGGRKESAGREPKVA